MLELRRITDNCQMSAYFAEMFLKLTFGKYRYRKITFWYIGIRYEQYRYLYTKVEPVADWGRRTRAVAEDLTRRVKSGARMVVRAVVVESDANLAEGHGGAAVNG